MFEMLNFSQFTVTSNVVKWRLLCSVGVTSLQLAKVSHPKLSSMNDSTPNAYFIELPTITEFHYQVEYSTARRMCDALVWQSFERSPKWVCMKMSRYVRSKHKEERGRERKQ